MDAFPRPSCADLDLAHLIYREREPREFFYRAAIELAALADRREADVSEAEGVAVLLWVWNAVFFDKRPAKRHSLVADLEALLRLHAEQLSGYRARVLDSLDDAEGESIMDLFGEFQHELGAVGAAKALHVLAPRFFPLWDDKIRHGYGVKPRDAEGHPDSYWRHLACLRSHAFQLLYVPDSAIGFPSAFLGGFSIVPLRLGTTHVLGASGSPVEVDGDGGKQEEMLGSCVSSPRPS